MNNLDTDATWAYHNGTKHSLQSLYDDPHYMDFQNQPLPFKIYSDLEPIPLPHGLRLSDVTALRAISIGYVQSEGEYIPDMGMLASVLHFSAGITKRKEYPGGEMLFRAAACTGALYHIELYLVCGDLAEPSSAGASGGSLEAGVYHFGTHDFALRQLRKGDYRSTLVRATGDELAVVDAPAVIICTGTYWRNAWKYRSRTYRHCFWDNGTILSNLLAIAAALGLPARVLNSFADDPVNGLLGLDTQREVALSLVPLGRTTGTPPPKSIQAAPLDLKTAPLSKTEVDYPAIRVMHEVSSLASGEEAATLRGRTPLARTPEPSGQLFPLCPQGDDGASADTIDRVILRRGSARQFVRRPIALSELSTILHRSTQGVPADFLDPEGATLSDLYLIVNAVEELPEGSYVFHRDKGALELLDEGDFRQVAGYLGLQQVLPADAAVDIFLLTDLKPVLERYGNRGYRAAQLEASIIGGRIYLASYAQKLGATGLTFFDDDVTNFFSPHAEGKSVMFLVAVGVPLRRQVTRH